MDTDILIPAIIGLVAAGLIVAKIRQSLKKGSCCDDSCNGNCKK